MLSWPCWRQARRCPRSRSGLGGEGRIGRKRGWVFWGWGGGWGELLVQVKKTIEEKRQGRKKRERKRGREREAEI